MIFIINRGNNFALKIQKGAMDFRVQCELFQSDGHCNRITSDLFLYARQEVGPITIKAMKPSEQNMSC